MALFHLLLLVCGSLVESQITYKECQKDQCGDSALLKIVDALSKDIASLKERYAQQVKTNEEQALINEAQAQRIKKLEMQKSDPREDVNNMQTPPVFFSATTTYRTRSYSQGEPITFNNVLTNIGPGLVAPYNSTTGMFTCPLDAYYLAMATLFKGTGSRSVLEAGAFLYTSDGHQAALRNLQHSTVTGTLYWSSTIHVIVRCARNEQIWLKADGGFVLDGFGGKNQFTVMLVKNGLE